MDLNSYRAIFSSDWNECLAPCGPFDFVAFNYPQFEEKLTDVFRKYTSNRISLGKAVTLIDAMLPESITPDQIDAYLERAFVVYRGVPELIDWCARHAVLFMINTTGMIGYFQRVFAKQLLPVVPVLSACPMIRFEPASSDPPYIHDLLETPDKGRNTAAVQQNLGIPSDRVLLMGDSGGDGPHFEWGAQQGALLIGSMTKVSLSDFCADRDILIDVFFGCSYRPGETKDLSKEMAVDFRDLIPIIERAIT